MALERCPFCKNEIVEGATVCGQCGAEKGYGSAGVSQNTAGYFGAVLIVLTIVMGNSENEVLAAFAYLTGFLGAAAIFVWMQNVGAEPKWHRPSPK